MMSTETTIVPMETIATQTPPADTDPVPLTCLDPAYVAKWLAVSKKTFMPHLLLGSIVNKLPAMAADIDSFHAQFAEQVAAAPHAVNLGVLGKIIVDCPPAMSVESASPIDSTGSIDKIEPYLVFWHLCLHIDGKVGAGLEADKFFQTIKKAHLVNPDDAFTRQMWVAVELARKELDCAFKAMGATAPTKAKPPVRVRTPSASAVAKAAAVAATAAVVATATEAAAPAPAAGAKPRSSHKKKQAAAAPEAEAAAPEPVAKAAAKPRRPSHKKKQAAAAPAEATAAAAPAEAMAAAAPVAEAAAKPRRSTSTSKPARKRQRLSTTEHAATDSSEPVAIETEPMETEPIETESIETESIETEPIETEPIETTETEPTETESIETKPIETESVESKPIETESVESIESESVESIEPMPIGGNPPRKRAPRPHKPKARVSPSAAVQSVPSTETTGVTPATKADVD